MLLEVIVLVAMVFRVSRLAMIPLQEDRRVRHKKKLLVIIFGVFLKSPQPHWQHLQQSLNLTQIWVGTWNELRTFVSK